jgi:hypothetical protein
MHHRRIRDLLAAVQVLFSLKAQIWGWDSSLVLPGCENLAADGTHLFAFSYNRALARSEKEVYGVLYHWDGTQETPFLKDITPPGEWKPFGLSYRAPYVWFFHGERDIPNQVWRFQWNNQQLESPRIWRHPGFVSLQAIWPLDSVRFMVANDRSHRGRWRLVLGFLVRRVRSTLWYCEGDSCTEVLHGIPYASSLAYFPEEKEWWVSVAFRRAIWIYQEVGGPHRLAFVRKIHLPGHPDNLVVLSANRVWAVCHPSLTRWARSLAFGSQADHWLIVEITRQPQGPIQTHTLYKSQEGYPTATVAYPMGPYIYVGSYAAPYLLRLKAKENNTTAAPR